MPRTTQEFLKRIEEEFDVGDLTKEKVEKYIKATPKTPGRQELAKEIVKAHELAKEIERAPTKEKLKELREEIKDLPIKRDEIMGAARERRIELTPVERFSR